MTNSNVCNASDTTMILSSVWYWGSNGIKLILAPPAIGFNMILIYVLYHCVLLHVNVRCLLTNLSVCSIVASGYLFEKGLATLIYYLAGLICNLELSSMPCYLREAIYVLFKLPVLGSILGLGVERVYSTKHAQTYTRNESPKLAVLVLTTLWTFAIASIAFLLITAPTDKRIVYCNALFIYDPLAIRILAGVLLPLELAGVALYAYIWIASVRWSSLNLLPPCLKSPIRLESFALSNRLQRRHNVAITAMMLPSVIFHAVCWTTILGVALVQVHLHQFSIETHLLVSQYLFYALTLAHMTVHPLMCFWNCDIIRWELVKLFPRLRSWCPSLVDRGRFVRQQSQQAEKHFELLMNMWEKHKPAGQRKKRRYREGRSGSQTISLSDRKCAKFVPVCSSSLSEALDFERNAKINKETTGHDSGWRDKLEPRSPVVGTLNECLEL